MNKLKILLQSKLFYIILFIGIILYVFINTIFIKYESVYSLENTEIIGKIISYKLTDKKLSLEVKAEEKIICNYYYQEIPNVDNLLGSTITMRGKLNEAINNTIPNTFNYKKYLYNKKIYHTFTIDNYQIKETKNIFYKVKNYLYKRINKNTKENEYLNLFILGNKNLLDQNEYKHFSENGVVHLFAISGMHISIMTLSLERMIKWRKKKRLIVSILWFYGFIVSFSISILRSLIFYTLKYILDLFNIDINNFKKLFLTIFIILLINPFYIYAIGFLYSFITVFSIFYFHNLIKGNYIKKLLETSIITFAATLPITVNLNYEVNLFSIINNLIFIPFITFIVYPASILTYIIPLLKPIYRIILVILEMINMILNKIDFLMISIPKISLFFCIFYYSILLFIKNKKNIIILVLITICLLKLLVKIDSSYYIHYLDIGQGDSSIIIAPHQNEVIMIDTGGDLFNNNSYHKSDNSIKFLKSIGINKIDLLIISHGDADHIGEAINIINNIKIKNIMINQNKINNLEKNTIRNIKVVYEYKLNNFEIKNYNDYLSDDENYSSIVTDITIKKYRFLFMGDLPKENEIKYLNDYHLKADYIKLGHHGSKTSSDKFFLKSVDPKLAIISSGRNNMYHHPSKEVINILNDLKIKYLNTQSSGTISLQINNDNVTITTSPP